jgi:hypothetical protein
VENPTTHQVMMTALQATPEAVAAVAWFVVVKIRARRSVSEKVK